MYSHEDGEFTFYVDGVVRFSVAPGTNIFTWQTATIPLEEGTHILRWSFTNGIRHSPSAFEFQSLSIKGIINSLLPLF